MTALIIILMTHLVNWSTGIMAWMPCCLVKADPGGWCPHTLNRLSAETPMARHPFCFMMEAGSVTICLMAVSAMFYHFWNRQKCVAI